MANFDQFIIMLTENDFDYSLTEINENKIVKITQVGYPHHEKIVGYSDFFTEFEFDKNGKLIKIGIWE